MAELDAKTDEKRPILDFGNTKRSPKELKELVKTLFDYYFEED
jgi:hypothetical protein